MKREGNVTIQVPMVKGSPMHKFYQQEAEKNGVRLPTHLFQLLKARYEAITNGQVWSWMPVHVMADSTQPALQAITNDEIDDDAIKTSGAAALKMIGGLDSDL